MKRELRITKRLNLIILSLGKIVVELQSIVMELINF
jgi:hypothetical protein